MRSWAYNRFGVLMGASWRASALRWPRLRGDIVPMITPFPSQGYFCATAVIAIIDNHGYVLAPVPVVPVNETDMVLLPESLQALKKVAKEVGLDLRGAYLNLDGGFDSIANRKCIFNAGMIPNIKENPVSPQKFEAGSPCPGGMPQ